MGKFDGYLICSDCDGTLTDSNRRISKENADAINYFQQNGGLFTVSTGRHPHYINEFKDVFVPNTYVVGCNGAVLYDLKEDRTICERPIKIDALPLLDYVMKNTEISTVTVHGKFNELFSFKRQGAVLEPAYDEFLVNSISVSDIKQINDYLINNNEDIFSVLFVQAAHTTMDNFEKLNNNFGNEYKFVIGWDMGIEALSHGSGKGEMITRMKSIMPKIHTTIGVGDYGNDISMLKLCDIGYAVDNAPSFVKKCADRVTVSCDESAIAHIIEDIMQRL